MTVPKAAQHCSIAAVWFGVRLLVISSASIASPCDAVQVPNKAMLFPISSQLAMYMARPVVDVRKVAVMLHGRPSH